MPQANGNPLVSPRISFYVDHTVLQIEIETERLYIRSYKDDDFEDCVALYGDEKITKYFDYGKPRSEAEVKDLINERGDKYFKQGEPFGLFSVFDKRSMTFIGQADLVPAGELGVVEVGCILHKQYHGFSFGTEIVKFFIISYINELNGRDLKVNTPFITKAIATVHPQNYASKKIIENLGMTFDKFQKRFGHPRLWYSYVPHLLIYESQKLKDQLPLFQKDTAF